MKATDLEQLHNQLKLLNEEMGELADMLQDLGNELEKLAEEL